MTSSASHRLPGISGRAFSLIELLVVITIMSVLLALAVSSFNSVASNTTLSRAGQTLSDQIILARQEAISKNREVEVRFFSLEPAAQGPRAMQAWLLGDDGLAQTPLGRRIPLPDTVRIPPSHSPLLSADTLVTGTADFPPHGQTPYNGFRFRPDGSVAHGLSASNTYLTLQLASEKNDPPANFYAVQVNPFTGKVSIHRP